MFKLDSSLVLDVSIGVGDRLVIFVSFRFLGAYYHCSGRNDENGTIYGV